MKLRYLLLPIIVLALAGCVQQPPKPQMNALQIQAMQSRDFKTTKKEAFNSVMSVFQNMGYIIKSASYGTGFITAQSPSKSHRPSFGQLFLDASIAGNNNAPSPVTTESTIATAFVTQRTKSEAKVRLNFVAQNSRSGGYGQQSQNNSPILDAKLYQNAFNKIRQEIFVSKGIKPTA